MPGLHSASGVTPSPEKIFVRPGADDIDDLNEYMELLRSRATAPTAIMSLQRTKVTHQPIGTSAVAVVKMAAAAGISATASTLPAGTRVMPKKW